MTINNLDYIKFTGIYNSVEQLTFIINCCSEIITFIIILYNFIKNTNPCKGLLFLTTGVIVLPVLGD